MSGNDWLKELMMLPARLHLASMAADEEANHALRKRLGDPEKRQACCEPRPDSFPQGLKVEDIAELREILELTSSIMAGHCPYYCCRVCGQEWFQDWEQLKFGGYIHVRKAP